MLLVSGSWELRDNKEFGKRVFCQSFCANWPCKGECKCSRFSCDANMSCCWGGDWRSLPLLSNTAAKFCTPPPPPSHLPASPTSPSPSSNTDRVFFASVFVSGSVFVCGCVCASAGRCVRRRTRRVCAFKSALLCRSSSSFCVSDALVSSKTIRTSLTSSSRVASSSFCVCNVLSRCAIVFLSLSRRVITSLSLSSKNPPSALPTSPSFVSFCISCFSRELSLSVRIIAASSDLHQQTSRLSVREAVLKL
mmetsp:Transcript_33854/g.49574  ORF Transcript_33854/g.49574 Transcript_33854/m.49574 type:complete len:250 (+) Transcript_33854:163-912(+)